MKTVINEFRNRGRFSRKIFEDVEITKIIFDNKFIPAEEDIIIKGFAG